MTPPIDPTNYIKGKPVGGGSAKILENTHATSSPIDPGSVADALTKFLMSDALFDVWKKCDMPMTMVTFGTAIYPFVTQYAREERLDELNKLEDHRAFIHWGDGSPSDLDSYLTKHIEELKEDV